MPRYRAKLTDGSYIEFTAKDYAEAEKKARKIARDNSTPGDTIHASKPREHPGSGIGH